MKIGKAVKWMFLCSVCHLNAQNNFSLDFSINSQPTESIKINETGIGIDYAKTFESKFRMENELQFNFKNSSYSIDDLSNVVRHYSEVGNKFRVGYFKSDKTSLNLELEPYIASENNLKFSDIDFLGELNVGFVLDSNKKLTIGASRNNYFGKTMVLPVFSYYYQYNKEVNVKLGFPESKLSYSNNVRNLFSLRNAFNGSLYNLENSSGSLASNSVKSSFSQLTTSLEYERNMDSDWYVNFKVGYDFNRKHLFLDSHYNTTYDFGIKDGCQFGLTIKYKH